MKRAATALALVAFTLATSVGVTSAAEDSLTPDEIVARSRAATGYERRPESEREAWSIRVAGLDGTLETVRDGADTASSVSLGPFRTAHGTAHGQRWHQNENGQTILERPEPSQAERIAAQTASRVRDPLDAWLIATTYASGHVLRAYYDAKTFRLVRTERVAQGRATHTTYDDFRIDQHGHTRSWHYFGGDDRPDNAYDYRLVRDDDADISESDLAVPHDRRTLVEFPAGVDAVRLPARIENDRIYVRLTVAGRGLDFLLDTGSSALTLDQGVARELHLPIHGRATLTVAGSFSTGRVIVPAITIGSLTMRDVVMRTVPFSTRETYRTRVVGLLGFDFIAALGLKIDYANGTLDASRPGMLGVPASATALDVRLNSGTPVARAAIGDASGEDFIIDTGAAFTYVVFQRFARSHLDALAPSGDGRVHYGSGVGGELQFRTIAARRVGLGRWTFDDALGAEALSSTALGFDNEDGLIGAGILKLFTVYLDYAANRVYLKPNWRMNSTEATNAH